MTPTSPESLKIPTPTLWREAPKTRAGPAQGTRTCCPGWACLTDSGIAHSAEPVFARLHGVISTEVGYTGGWKTDPTYEDVHDPPKGQPSGHAFAVRIGYDPGHITLKMLLEVFFDAHGEWC